MLIHLPSTCPGCVIRNLGLHVSFCDIIKDFMLLFKIHASFVSVKSVIRLYSFIFEELYRNLGSINAVTFAGIKRVSYIFFNTITTLRKQTRHTVNIYKRVRPIDWCNFYL